MLGGRRNRAVSQLPTLLDVGFHDHHDTERFFFRLAASAAYKTTPHAISFSPHLFAPTSYTSPPRTSKLLLLLSMTSPAATVTIPERITGKLPIAYWDLYFEALSERLAQEFPEWDQTQRTNLALGNLQIMACGNAAMDSLAVCYGCHSLTLALIWYIGVSKGPGEARRWGRSRGSEEGDEGGEVRFLRRRRGGTGLFLGV